MSATLGQHDAGGPLTNSQYSVTGGFWVLPQAKQIEGTPTLSIMRAGFGQATISWIPATPCWILQEAPAITGDWTNLPSGATNPVTVPALLPQKFYRLIKP